MDIPVLNSRRLVLRPLQSDDAEDIQRLFPHREIVRLMTSQIPWPYPDGAALEFINNVALPAMAACRRKSGRSPGPNGTPEGMLIDNATNSW